MDTGRIMRSVTLAVSIALLLTGCMSQRSDGSRSERAETWVPSDDIPKLPEKLKTDQATGIPSLKVYDVSAESLEEINIEDYIMGVVAGEMKNDWPMEAMKAQAILARTFVMKFCADRESKYKGADISTDVTEAQAYDAGSVNDRVRQAVDETRGQVMAWHGGFPNAWFHAHAGGMTELPTVALDYREDDPEYLKPVESSESGKAPDSVKHWTAEFDRSEVAKACRDTGAGVGEVESVEIGERGGSGRAKTLIVNGESVSAPSFRIQIGANVLKSTLIESVEVDGEKVRFTGSGFGHGVGMSQWGAYEMAERGADAGEIIRHYFDGVDIVDLW